MMYQLNETTTQLLIIASIFTTDLLSFIRLMRDVDSFSFGSPILLINLSSEMNLISHAGSLIQFSFHSNLKI
jgi:hypothetical protein